MDEEKQREWAILIAEVGEALTYMAHQYRGHKTEPLSWEDFISQVKSELDDLRSKEIFNV
jgi:hypothetical protein